MDKQVPCAYCQAAIADHYFLACALCETPFHKECWESTKRCSVYGCESESSILPAELLYRRAKGLDAVPALAPTAALDLLDSTNEITRLDEAQLHKRIQLATIRHDALMQRLAIPTPGEWIASAFAAGAIFSVGAVITFLLIYVGDYMDYGRKVLGTIGLAISAIVATPPLLSRYRATLLPMKRERLEHERLSSLLVELKCEVEMRKSAKDHPRMK